MYWRRDALHGLVSGAAGIYLLPACTQRRRDALHGSVRMWWRALHGSVRRVYPRAGPCTCTHAHVHTHTCTCTHLHMYMYRHSRRVHAWVYPRTEQVWVSEEALCEWGALP